MVEAYSAQDIVGVGGQEFFSESVGVANRWRNFFWRQTHGGSKCDNVWMLMGLCCSYRRSVLLELGGFDESYRTNGEDVDIGTRLNQSGFRLLYNPEIGVKHTRNDSLTSLFRMVGRHAFWQSRALRKNNESSSFLMKNDLRWLLITIGSSIKRHRSPKLLLLSPFCCLVALVARTYEKVSS